jgi:hypothetical protein|tara:strand:- start:673 stop:1392 length:720 start_codon:yes stop_codon:yes gene_type:complete
MAASSKLKWKRILNRLRFYSMDLDSGKEIMQESAPDFQAYYEDFCSRHNIDIAQLNDQHRERVQGLYGKPDPEDSTENEPEIGKLGDTSIVVHKSPSPVPTPSEPYQMTQDEKEMHEAFSKLFKKIALSLHPDRVDKNLPPETRKDMVSRFRKANRAMEQRKYFILLDIADELNITTPRNYAQQNRWMKREIDRIEPLVRAQKNTYNYKFADTETDDERDVLIKQFLYQLFGFQLPENS